MNGTKPEIAHRKGFYFELKAGERYFWCSCGRSKQQPFCDGCTTPGGFDVVGVIYPGDNPSIQY